MKSTSMVEKFISLYIFNKFPHLNSVHYPVLARVMKVYGEGSYVDIRILDKNRNIDIEYPEIPKVKTKQVFRNGDIVKVIFFYNDINMPYIEGKVD